MNVYRVTTANTVSRDGFVYYAHGTTAKEAIDRVCAAKSSPGYETREFKISKVELIGELTNEQLA